MSKFISSIIAKTFYLKGAGETASGVLHTDAADSGYVYSGYVVDEDIENATISNAKLATKSTSAVADTIVIRDSNAAITAKNSYNRNDVNSDYYGQVQCLGATDPGKICSIGFNTTSNQGFIASLSGASGTTLVLNPAGGLVKTQNNTMDNGSGAAQFTAAVTLSSLSTGLIHADSNGLLSSSLIADADIALGVIAENKLATEVSVTTTNDSLVKRTFNGAIYTAALTASGIVTLSNYTTAGILHNAVSTGIVSSSLIVDADITTGTISESKLATVVSTTNTPDAIVKRGPSGEISLGAITTVGSLTLSSLGTGVLHANSSGVITSSLVTDSDITNSSISEGKLSTSISDTASNSSIVKRTGSGGIASTTLNASGLVTLSNYTTAGILHNAVTTGLLSSSLIVDADLTVGTIAENKLATSVSTTATNDSIVKRDGSAGIAVAALTVSTINASALITASQGVTIPGGANYALTLGTANQVSQAASNGAYFTDALTGDFIIRSQSNNLLIGAAAGYSNIKMTSTSNTFLLPVLCGALTASGILQANVLYAATASPQLIPKGVSDNIRHSYDEQIAAINTTYAMQRKITFTNGLIGTQRFRYSVICSPGTTTKSQLRKNGVLIGVENSTYDPGAYVTYTQDLTVNWLPGDSLELWGWFNWSNEIHAYHFKEMRVSYDDAPVIAVSSSNTYTGAPY